jgi:nucleoside-diphosphate-sugar epimerase
MRILVIGGTKFMGPAVVQLLHDRGDEVTVFHRGQTNAGLPAGVGRILGDRRSLAAHQVELQKLAPEIVLDMLPMLEEDARTITSLFKGIARRVVAISSQDVYRNFGRLIGTETGPPDPIPLTEESPLRTNWYPYRGQTPRGEDDPNRWRDNYDKIPVERIMLGEPALPGTVLRLPAVYGPRDSQRRLYGFLKRMDDKRPFILLDRASINWRWTRSYMENAAAAIVLAVTDDRAAGKVYNVGDQNALSNVELVEAIAKVVGWQGQIVALPSERLPKYLVSERPDQDLIVDSTRIRAELGYNEKVSVCDGIARTVQWDRTNPPAFDPAQFDYAAEDAAVQS